MGEPAVNTAYCWAGCPASRQRSPSNMTISLALLMLALLSIGYWLLLALASIRAPGRPDPPEHRRLTRFAIAIPAHDEASVIGSTVDRLHHLDYPTELFTIHVVADHCSDD